MKNLYLICFILFIITTSALAQSPELINFQALITNEDGGLDSTEVDLNFSILKENPETGELVYSESHKVITNSNGLINLKIGAGDNSSGAFKNISWGESTYYIISEFSTDGENYELLSNSQLVSVPYALHSKTASKLTTDNYVITGNGENEDFFQVRNNNYSRATLISASDELEPTAGFFGKKSSGTLAEPTNIKENSRITGLYAQSYIDEEYIVNAALEMVAGQEVGVNGAASYMKFGTTDVGSTERNERMRIAENGNVGIGTSDPTNLLSVTGAKAGDERTMFAINNLNSSTNNSAALEIKAGSNTNSTTLRMHADNYSYSWWAKHGQLKTQGEGLIIEATKDDGSGGNIVFVNGQTGTTAVNKTVNMQINSNGNVGIGTTNPGHKLDVNGSLNANSLYLNGELFDPETPQSVTEPFTLTGSGQASDDMITLKNNNYTRIRAYTANNDLESVAAFIGGRSGGTLTNPTNIAPEQRITGLYGSSYRGTEYEVSTSMEFISGKESGVNGTSSYIKFGTTGIGSTQRNERMRIAENGNVGIGTSDPSNLLSITGAKAGDERTMFAINNLNNSTNNSAALEIKAGSNTNSTTLRMHADNYSYSWWAKHGQLKTQGEGLIIEATKDDGSGGNIVFVNGQTGVTNIEKTVNMQINSDGNIGIGTTAPKSKLQVTNGDIYIEDAASGVIMTSPDGNCWRMTVDNSGNPQFTSTTCPQ